MSKVIILKDELGTEYELNYEQAEKLNLITKRIKKPWIPKFHENYFFLNEGLLIKENQNTNRNLNKIRQDRFNVFKSVSDARQAANFLRGDINNLIIKFAIENNCLATIDDTLNKSITKYQISFDSRLKKYGIVPCTDVLCTTPLLMNYIVASELVDYLNKNKLGYLNKNNFKEKEIIVNETSNELDEIDELELYDESIDPFSFKN